MSNERAPEPANEGPPLARADPPPTPSEDGVARQSDSRASQRSGKPSLKHLPPMTLHSPSSILGTPFDGVSRFEYPFPTDAPSALSSPELPHSPVSAPSAPLSATSSYASLPMLSPPLPSFTTSLSSLSIPAVAPPPPLAGPLPVLVGPNAPSHGHLGPSLAPAPAPFGDGAGHAPPPSGTRSYSPTHPRLQAAGRGAPPVPPSLAAKKKKRFSTGITLPNFNLVPVLTGRGSTAPSATAHGTQADGAAVEDGRHHLPRAQTLPAGGIPPWSDAALEEDLAKMTDKLRAQLGSRTSPSASSSTSSSSIASDGTSSAQLTPSDGIPASIAEDENAENASTIILNQDPNDVKKDNITINELGPVEDVEPLKRPALKKKGDSGETIVPGRRDGSPDDAVTEPSEEDVTPTPPPASQAMPPDPRSPHTARTPLTPLAAHNMPSPVVPALAPPPSTPLAAAPARGTTSPMPHLLSRATSPPRLPTSSASPFLPSSPPPGFPPLGNDATPRAAASSSPNKPRLISRLSAARHVSPKLTLAPLPAAPSRPSPPPGAGLRHRKSFPGAVDQGRVGFGQEAKGERWL